MKKSTFWIIAASVSIILAAYCALNNVILHAMFGCATCCVSLVFSAYYEREERTELVKHESTMTKQEIDKLLVNPCVKSINITIK